KGPDLLNPTLATTDLGTGIDKTAGTETVIDAALSNFPAGYWDKAVIWISAIGYSPRKAWGAQTGRVSSSVPGELWALAGVGSSGIIMTGSDKQLLTSRIGYSAGNGVVAQGPNRRIENNLIHDVNYLAGNMSGVRANGRNITIRKNTICNSGRELTSS